MAFESEKTDNTLLCITVCFPMQWHKMCLMLMDSEKWQNLNMNIQAWYSQNVSSL